VKPHKKSRAGRKAVARQQALRFPHWFAPAAIAALVLVFYWIPLTSASAGIQWDAADMHYPLQRYFADQVRSGALPLWTPYLYAGYPFLSNPEVAAWYPPHWLFYLLGVTPRAIQAEIAVSALLACLGGFVFLAPLVKHRAAALLGGLMFGLSGFFAGHASHVGICAAAAWLPWLLAAYRHAMEAKPARHAALGAIAGGCMLLAGYFQTALYGFMALGLYAAADLWLERRDWRRAALTVAGILAGALALGAVQILPGLELTAESFRSGANFSDTTEGLLQIAPLATLYSPDALGAVSGNYRGPSDVTQYYWYAGFLLLPLAALGAVKTRWRVPALALLIPALWYMAGPAAGLYRIGAIIPGMHKVRAPIQGWFIAAFALAFLAAAGAAWILERWHHPGLAAGLIALVFVDLMMANSVNNPLAYSRSSFETVYGAREALAARQIAATQPPLTRFDEPPNGLPLGPLDHALNLRLETTSGYFALSVARMVHYTEAIARNPKLRAGANAGRYLNLSNGAIETVPDLLPRAYFPKTVRDVADSRQALETLDPAAGSIVEAPHAPIQQDPAATATVTAHSSGAYRVRYTAATPSLLKLAESWFPGWRASSGGADLPVVRLDHAFMGVVVPPGSGEVEFRYRSTRFLLGAAISVLGAALLAAIALRFPGRVT
jgi:hypothetical protein